MAYKGFFRPKNITKYQGDPTKVVYRSRWELLVMDRLDRDPNVLAWSSENIVVPYQDKSSGRIRRYFPDFFVKKRGPDGRIQELLIEVKPAKEANAPVRGTKTEKRFLAECLLYARNQSKWEAARRMCEKRGWHFVVLTEKELGIKF